MEIPTIAVTAVQVHLNPVHTENCWLSYWWPSFTRFKAKLSKQWPLGEESPSHEHCHDALYVWFCKRIGGLGFKKTRREEISENTKDFWSAPKKIVEQPLTPGFAFEMRSDAAHWDMLELTTPPNRSRASKNWWRSCRFSQGTFILSQEKEHPFNPESPCYAVPTYDTLYSYKIPEWEKATPTLGN